MVTDAGIETEHQTEKYRRNAEGLTCANNPLQVVTSEYEAANKKIEQPNKTIESMKGPAT